MTIYQPTYLYVKQHAITGLKYFGKTVKPDPYAYKGSGTRWTRHLRKHGNEHVITLWTKLFTSEEELIEYATKFSIENNIVEDTSWANLCIEQGTEGGPRHNSGEYFRETNSKPKPKKVKQAISKSMTGNQNKSIPVLYNGKVYKSTVFLAKELGFHEETIRNWKKKGIVVNLSK